MGDHLTSAELATRWSRPRKWVGEQAKVGAIPAVRIGGQWRFPLAEIEAHEQRMHNAYRDPLSIAPRRSGRRPGPTSHRAPAPEPQAAPSRRPA